MSVLAIAAIAGLVVPTVLLERWLEHRNRRSAWGAFLAVDRMGITHYHPLGAAVYIVQDADMIRRIECVSARGIGTLIAGGVFLAAIACILIAVEEHELSAAVGALAFAGWAALIGWVVHELRTIAHGLPRTR